VQKAEKKGRTKEEVDEIIEWLTGYTGKQLRRAIDAKLDLETFFTQAPRMNPSVALIKGVVCGVRVEEVASTRAESRRSWAEATEPLIAAGPQLGGTPLRPPPPGSRRHRLRANPIREIAATIRSVASSKKK
jgi:hypothetical protein